jgi:hypothetical protein
MVNNIEHGQIKILFYRKPEQRTSIICQEVVKQLDEEKVPTIIFTTSNDAKEWTEQLLGTAGVTPEALDENLLKRISEMPLYINVDRSNDIGYLSWKILNAVENQKVRKVYIESSEALTVFCPNENECNVGDAVGTVLRHLADSLGIEIILLSSSTIPGEEDQVLEYPEVYIKPNGLNKYADEIIHINNLR